MALDGRIFQPILLTLSVGYAAKILQYLPRVGCVSHTVNALLQRPVDDENAVPR